MSLAYPGESSVLSDIVGRDAFLEALDDQTVRVRILEKESKNVNEALNIASRLEAFDIMGFAGPEGEKSKSRFARAAAGGKEFTSSEGTKAPEETAKQIADLKALISSYWRDLDKQQHEISMLRRGHQPYGNLNLSLDRSSCPAEADWTGARSSFPEPTPDQREPAWAVGPPGEEEVTEFAVGPAITAGTVEKGATGRAPVHFYAPQRPCTRGPSGNGGSVSIVTARRNGVDVYLALRLHGRGVYGLLDKWVRHISYQSTRHFKRIA